MVAGQIALLTDAVVDYARYPASRVPSDHVGLFELARSCRDLGSSDRSTSATDHYVLRGP